MAQVVAVFSPLLKAIQSKLIFLKSLDNGLLCHNRIVAQESLALTCQARVIAEVGAGTVLMVN